jgi:Pyruvate/2-oxoacid:ferredoxin oxidoreductase delta subunit
MAQSTIDTLIQVAGVTIGLIAGFITLFLNEYSKRSEEEYKRKELRYVELITALRGFYVDSHNTELKDSFLRQLNLCWLYCPDDVIRKAYAFLATVHTDAKQPDAIKERALGELILAVRQDLLLRKSTRRTDLKPKDFRHLRAT